MTAGENKRENNQQMTNLVINHFSPYPHFLASRLRRSYTNSKNDQLSLVQIPLPTGFKKNVTLLLTLNETLTHSIFETIKDCIPMMNETIYLNCQIKNILSLPSSLKHAHISKLNFTLVNFTCVFMVQKPLIRSKGGFQLS